MQQPTTQRNNAGKRETFQSFPNKAEGTKMMAPSTFSLLILTLAGLVRSTSSLAPSSSSSSAASRRDFLNTAVTGAGLLTASSCSQPAIADASPSPSSSPGGRTTICVTGANGYIGLHCVSQLLEEGYAVKAALRTVTEPKTKYLQKIAADLGATDRLDFASVDLLSASSMTDAARGCDAMLHVASPFTLKTSGGDPLKTIVEPAVAGAVNAVEAARTLGLRRVVATGSIFGMVGSGSEKGFDHVYGSDDVNGFNTPGGCAYAYSKMAAQQQSAASAARDGVDLVTLNVGQVCGPALSPEQINPSWEPFKLLAKAQPGGAVLGCCVPGFCDVRDVARAHVAALGLPAEQGPRRYGVASRRESPTYVEIAETYAGILPERNLPKIVEALPAKVQELVVKGIKLGDKSLGELLEGVTIPEGETLLVDTDPMLRDLVPRPRAVEETLKDWFDNQTGYGHKV